MSSRVRNFSSPLARRGGRGFEQLLHKRRQIDAPVAPDMAAVGLHILVFIVVIVKEPAQIGIGFVKEIGVSNGNPIQLWVAVEERFHLLLERFVGLHLVI